MTKPTMALEATLPPGDPDETTALRSLVKRAESGDTTTLAEIRTRFAAVPAA